MESLHEIRAVDSPMLKVKSKHQPNTSQHKLCPGADVWATSDVWSPRHHDEDMHHIQSKVGAPGLFIREKMVRIWNETK